MKFFLIDGYNVLHKMPIRLNPNNLKLSRSILEKKLLSMVLSSSYSISLVYDGKYSPVQTEKEVSNKLKVYFSAENETADELIKKFIDKRQNQRKLLIVVSSDRHILNYANVSGVNYMTSEEFLNAFVNKGVLENKKVKPKKHFKDIQLTDKEVSDWEKIFESR